MKTFLILGLIYSCGSLKWGRNYRIEFQTKRPEFIKILEYSLAEIEAPTTTKIRQISCISVSGKEKLQKYFRKAKIKLPIDKELIPLKILDSSEKRQEFLRGFFEGKSSVCSSKRLIKVSGKDGQLEGIKKLLMMEGINSRIYSNGDYLSLYIEGKIRCENFRKIGFLSREKQEMFEQVSTYGRWKANYSMVFKN
jgi:hypothetical protein